MVTPNRLLSIPSCPPALGGWKALSEFPLAAINEQAPKILAKGMPAGSFCQKGVSHYILESRSEYASLLLTPHQKGLFESPIVTEEVVSAAISLIAERRHPSATDMQAISTLATAALPNVDAGDVNGDWVVVDTVLTPQIVALIRFELNDSDAVLFRKAKVGEAYYVTTDVAQLSRIVAVTQELKRDLSAVGLHDAASTVNGVAVQLTYIQSHQQGVQPFWRKPWHELWPMAVVGAVGAVGIGWGFHEGGVLSTKLHQGAARLAEWIRNNRNPPAPPTAGAGMGSDAGVARLRSVSTPTDADEFSSLDDRMDAGEAADFQIDPTRSYDRLQHIHINGAAVAAVIIAGGVVLLIPEIIPLVAGASPEAVAFASGLGAFAASH